MIKNKYNFLSLAELPTGDYIDDELSFLKDIKRAKTSYFNNVANNHCGAVFITNVVVYYTKIGYNNLMINNLSDTFKAVHAIVGNGPKIFLSKKAKLYFSQRGYRLKSSRFRSFERIKKSISNDRPIGLLLCAGPLEWHWVMAVGWIQYGSGELYIQIVTGWDSKTTKFYKLRVTTCWLFATSYAIKD